MADNYNFDNTSEALLESELFSLVNTILNIYEKYQNGIVKEIFFQKALKNAINNLVKFNLQLDKKNIPLSKLLKKMNFVNEYYSIIEIINEFSSLDFPNVPKEDKSDQKSQRISDKMRSIVLELPGITLEITSSFITLMDALKLEGFTNNELLDDLFINLKKNLKLFPGMEDILIQVDKIHERIVHYSSTINKNNKLSEIMVDDIYQLYKEFQNKLSIKT